MKELTQIIVDATRSIEATYFHLNIAGGNAVYRERVYTRGCGRTQRPAFPAPSIEEGGK
jgi:hypothetical protein